MATRDGQDALTLTMTPRRKPNRWVQEITEAWRSATEAWERQAEAVALGYDTELAEYAAVNPKPRLKDFMVHMSQQAPWAPCLPPIRPIRRSP